MVAAHHDQAHLRTAGAVDEDWKRLEQRAGRHTERVGHRLNGGHARGVDKLGCRELRRQLHGLSFCAGHLEVGRISGRQRDVVLARRARRHVLVGADPAHHSHVGLHSVPLEPAAVEHAAVGHDVLVVLRREPLEVAIERVGVLHDELAGPQDAGTRPGLVAFLDLEVVEDQRQVAIRAHCRRHMAGDDFLVGHGQHHVGAAAVLELEQLIDLVAARPPPRLGRMEHGHQQLLTADRVHLLAHDLHDLLVHAPARRQPRPQPRPDLPDQAGAHHENVRDRLGIGRRVALGGQEVTG